MPCGKKRGRPHQPQDGGGRDDGGVPRRRGRPPRRVRVAVLYRPRSEKEKNETEEAVRLLLREMVRRRMDSI